MDVQEALDTDLDAYLDRELFIQPDSQAKAKPTPGAEKPAERLQSVIALAAEEEQWLRTLPAARQPTESSEDPEGGECAIPEHLKVKPAPVVEPVAPPQEQAPWIPPAPLPGLALAPHLVEPGWNLPAAPAPVAPSRAPWIITGALVGVGAASVLVAGMLWLTRDTLPTKAQAVAGYVPAGTVAAVVPPPATSISEPVLSVKDSPLPRQSEQHLVGWSAAEVLPGPVVPGRMATRQEPPPPAPAQNPQPKAEPAPGALAQAVANPEPKSTLETGAIARAASEPTRTATATGDKPPAPIRSSQPSLASVKAEAHPPREKVQASRAPAVAEQSARGDTEDPFLEEMEDETPFMEKPVAAPAPAAVAKAEPPADPKPKEKETDFDEEFHRELGFSKDAVRKEPESKGVKSVWIPPDPSANLPETLTTADIQQVVVANQPAIVSCIRSHKDAIPGLTGGKFILRWVVHPDGTTTRVLMETQALRGTALASCLEELARSWTFPKHRTQMAEPVRFPFTF